MKSAVGVSLSLLLLASACSDSPETSDTAKVAATQEGEAKDDPLPPVPSPYDALPAESRGLLDKPFTGDLDAMVKRRMVRAGVVFNRTQYFIDKGQQRGISYESLKLFEEELNKRLKTGAAQGARGHRAASTRPAVPRAAIRQGRSRGGSPDRDAGTQESCRVQHADAFRRLGDRRDRLPACPYLRAPMICRAARSTFGGAAVITRA